ncbi:MAG: hypothetical protein HRT55_14430 [Colwellia sp.]|uniref:beta-1,3-glucanase family protein n=1 Tax=Colwellia sp. TaxID=56799 RepID=UPI0025BBCF75|nr:beta-1,3-glucanase family protein [Colwellia sp.]NQZ27500.1 hypothetical protein [Colwellia sp.]
MVNHRIQTAIYFSTLFAKQWLFFLLYCICFFIGSIHVNAQTLPLPYLINNASAFSDNDIYVGLVGKIEGNNVWIDIATGEINEMQSSDNTLQGPIHNGNSGPGGDGRYADIFTRLGNIPNKTINIPHIDTARIFISFESPLYLYFFADGGGYSTPSLTNDSDANLGLKFELIELSYDDNGLSTNTTRVDAYQYPMGLEVWSTDGFYKRIGEVLSHDDILTQWRTDVSLAFQASLDEELGIILNPSLSSSFQEGEANEQYFTDYVDALWNRYEAEELYVYIDAQAVWLGRVTNEQFTFTNQTDQTVAIISAKPTTLEILTTSGVLAEDVSNTPNLDADKYIQQHFSTALNMGAIDLNIETNQLADWSAIDSYFSSNIHNEYLAFWHSQDISYQGQTFAYNDSHHNSAIIQSLMPERVTITIGGLVNDAYHAAESIEVYSITGGDGETTLISYGTNTSEHSSGIGFGINTTGTVLLEARLLPLNVTVPTIIWQSSDASVASVIDGLITGISTGTALITASNHDGAISITWGVEVNDDNLDISTSIDTTTNCIAGTDSSATLGNKNDNYAIGTTCSITGTIELNNDGLSIPPGTINDTVIIEPTNNNWAVVVNNGGSITLPITDITDDNTGTDNNSHIETTKANDNSETVVASEVNDTQAAQTDSGGSISFALFSLFGMLLWRKHKDVS